MVNFVQFGNEGVTWQAHMVDIGVKLSRSLGNITKSRRYYKLKKTVKSLLVCYLAICKVFSRSLRIRRRRHRRHSDSLNSQNSEARDSIRGGRKRGKRLNTN